MDKIQFSLTEVKPFKKSNLKDFDVKVVLNGQTLKHSIFNGCQVVAASRYDFAEFDLFTCSCGVSGCAGFHIEIIQNKTGDKVKWTFPDDKSYAVEKLEFEFERVEFEQEFEQLRTKIFELEKDNAYMTVCISDTYEYGTDGTEVEQYEVREKLSKTFAWYEGRYEANQNFNIMLKEKFPDVYGKSLCFKYEGKTNDKVNSFDLTYLVCRSINKWPESKNQKSYLKKSEKAGKAIEKALFENDFQEFTKMVHAEYAEFNDNKDSINESVWSAFEYSLDRLVKKDNFDMNKLSIILF